MHSRKRDNIKYPAAGKEFDIECYREHWYAKTTSKKSKGHFDAGGKSGKGKGRWINNPQRFLLFGRPQIGKTGAFLHLAWLFQQKIEPRPPVLVDEIDDEPAKKTPPATSLEPHQLPDTHTYDAFPDYDTIKGLDFNGRRKLTAGKYGDPGSDTIWSHYTEDPKESSVHPDAAKNSSAGKSKRDGSASERDGSGILVGTSGFTPRVDFQLRRMALPDEADTAEETRPELTILISSAGPDVEILRGLVKPMEAHTAAFSRTSTHGTFRVTTSGDSGGKLQLLGRESKVGYGVSVNDGAMVASNAVVLLAKGSTVNLLQHKDPKKLPCQDELAKYRYCVVGPLHPTPSPPTAPGPEEQRPTANHLAKKAGVVAHRQRSTTYKFKLANDTLVLSVPVSEKKWWDLPTQSLSDGVVDCGDKPPKISAESRDIKFPIFSPSVGRADIGLLDLSDAIPTSSYLHVVVVKPQEIAEYRERWPDKTLLVLPDSADAKGVGASRYWIQRFAEVACSADFPYCFVLDDSVEYWKGMCCLFSFLFHRPCWRWLSALNEVPLFVPLSHVQCRLILRNHPRKRSERAVWCHIRA